MTSPEVGKLALHHYQSCSLTRRPLIWCVTVTAPFETLLAAKQTASSTQSTREVPQDVTWFDYGKEDPWPAMLPACTRDSPARFETLKEPVPDEEQTVLSLPFVHNLTENQDICQNTAARHAHSFFISPASCPITHTLLPIFSSGKPSIFNDILSPAIWYWIKMKYDDYEESEDMEWSEKKEILYWTGATTGGWATAEYWHKLHRQRLILRTTSETASATILQRSDQDSWRPQSIPWSNLSHVFDLRLTSIPSSQCTPEACDAMRQQFLQDPSYVGDGDNPNADPSGAAYAAKYVLDLDGNAFSGRFYRLLKSKSAVVKQTVFKEWHDGRLVPWVHFVPISPSGDELGEVMRFLTQEEAGRKIGEEHCKAGAGMGKTDAKNAGLGSDVLQVVDGVWADRE